MRCAIWYYLHNLKNVRNAHGGVLILVKLQAEACNFTKINTLSWVFFTFFKLYKWYQIVQCTTDYGCFEDITKEHNVKSCTNRRICKVCNDKQPTALHGYVRKKKQNDNQENDSVDTPNGVDVKCATVNTGGNMISMCVVPVNL